MLVLDDLQTHFARSVRVRNAAKQFIERYLGANDIAAIVQTGARKDGAQEFTSNRRLLLKAIDNFAGQKIRSATLDKIDDFYMQREYNPGAPPRDLSEAERAFKARNTMATLRQVADYLAGVRGRRKAVVYFSEGIDYDIENTIQNRFASDVRDEMQSAIAAATRANVSFYGIDPRGLTGLSDEAIDISSLPSDPTLNLGFAALNDELRRSQDSLRILSDETGGFAAVNRNDFRDAFGRIIQDNSSYYLLGYYSTDTRRDGRFRKLEVRVKRPGLTVRARRGYVAPKGKPPATDAANKATSAALREALDSPIPISGLGISLFAAPLKGAAPNGSVALTLEIEGRRLSFASENGQFHDDLEVSVLAVDRDTKIRDGGRDVVQLRLKPTDPRCRREERRADLAAAGAAARPLSAAGRRSRRRQRRDRLGPLRRRGSGLRQGAAVDERRCFSAPPTPRRIPTANPDPDFKDVLPAQPTAMRDFPRNDQLALFTEVYDNQTKVAHRVSIKTTVIADDGKVVHTAEDERKSEELKGAKGGYGYATTIDTSNARARPLRPARRGHDAPDQRRQGDARAGVPDPVSTDIRTIARGDASRIVDGTP